MFVFFLIKKDSFILYSLEIVQEIASPCSRVVKDEYGNAS